LRATVEGVTYALKFGIDELSRLGLAAGEIILIGGGAKSRAWRQIVADICGLPVMLLEHEEGASFGAALQSLWVLQRQTDPSLGIRDITAEHIARDEASGAMPNPAHQEAYARAYGAYQRAVAQIAPFY
jgi:xylulokinase